MIIFALHCEQGHEFEAWFRNNEDFETQNRHGFVECPICASRRISKALMAPAVSTARMREKTALAAGEAQKQALAQLKELSEHMRQNADYVGEKFAEEARKIHFGEVEPHNIYGQATLQEARELVDDGVEFLPVPVFPDDMN